MKNKIVLILTMLISTVLLMRPLRLNLMTKKPSAVNFGTAGPQTWWNKPKGHS